MSYYGHGGWGRYVPVAERRAKAKKQMQKLEKKGMKIQPIEIEGRKIAKTFWGKSWCDHMESFHDYENRLPRGRTYVRNGSVCHLSIETGKIHAMVSGSEIYKIDIEIKPLSKAKWNDIKKACRGQIGSMLELLSGKLSDNIMDVVCNQQTGLFPNPNEITFNCNCPDYARMCKHVAAVFYGVGARLDTAPEALFLLRGVDHEELIDVSSAVVEATEKSSEKDHHLSEDALSDIFGIEFEAVSPEIAKETSKKKRAKVTSKGSKKGVSKTEKMPQQKSAWSLENLTGDTFKVNRLALGFTQTALAQKLGVSTASISVWERKGKNPLTLKAPIRKKLEKVSS